MSNLQRSIEDPSLKTWNDQRNQPMLAINEALGFAKQPAWIGLELRLSP